MIRSTFIFILLAVVNASHCDIKIFPNEVYVINNDEYPYEGPRKTIIHDVNNDNFPDVVYLINSGKPGPIGEPPNNQVRVMINDGKGGISEVLNKDDSFQFLSLLINNDEPIPPPNIRINRYIIEYGDIVEGNFELKGEIYGPPFHKCFVVDWNQNGVVDLLALNISPYNPGFMIIPGKPDGTYDLGLIPFDASPSPPNRGWNFDDVGDINNDGIQDKIDYEFDNSEGDNKLYFHILLGTDDDNFIYSESIELRTTFGVFSTSFDNIYMYDFNADGNLDILRVNFSTLAFMHFGSGDGTFEAAFSISNGSFGWFFQFGDFNGDKIPDILRKHCSLDTGLENELYISLGKEDGTFTSHRTYHLLSDKHQGYAIPSMIVVDYNNDGRDDLWFDNGQPGEFRVSGVWINQYQEPSNLEYFEDYK